LPAAGLGAPEANLAWRAAQAFVDAARWDTGWQIEITKQIPVGGGLGGGSADAAAVLRALNALCPAPFPRSVLCEIGGTLGADVPFLVADVSRAWAWGRGDRFVVLPPLPSRPVRLFSFPEGVNTATAYGAFAAARAKTMVSGRATQAHVYTQDTFASWERIADVAANDFETVVSTMHAGVAAALPRLHALAARATSREALGIGMMSGSGATCLFLANELHDDDTFAGPHVIDTSTL
jgi:4-diphosphocytidyl-2-C-methyl-D-erythritol kinase